MFNGWIGDSDWMPLPENRKPKKFLSLKLFVVAFLILGTVTLFAKPRNHRPVVFDPPGAIDTLTYVDKPVVNTYQWFSWYLMARTVLRF